MYIGIKTPQITDIETIFMALTMTKQKKGNL